MKSIDDVLTDIKHHRKKIALCSQAIEDFHKIDSRKNVIKYIKIRNFQHVIISLKELTIKKLIQERKLLKN